MQIGIATHQNTHLLAALDEQGRILGTREVVNTGAGWAEALGWAQQLADERRWEKCQDSARSPSPGKILL